MESARIRSVATDEELMWALTYDGYERFSQDMKPYSVLLRPAISAYEASGRIPEWCGVDLLLAWASIASENITTSDTRPWHVTGMSSL